MIQDNIQNLENYKDKVNNLHSVINFINDTDLSLLEEGKYDIDGKNCFAHVTENKLVELKLNKFEAHKDYMDLYILVKGYEKVGIVKTSEAKKVTVYDPNTDVIFYECKDANNINYVDLTTDNFVILEPSDAHQPNIETESSSSSKKITFKLKIK